MPDVSTAVPSRYFAVPPYRAEQFRADIDTAGVMNANGVNCLTFSDYPGKVLDTFAQCQAIADKWNAEWAASSLATR